jgi:hypothetical protein
LPLVLVVLQTEPHPADNRATTAAVARTQPLWAGTRSSTAS